MHYIHVSLNTVSGPHWLRAKTNAMLQKNYELLERDIQVEGTLVIEPA